MEINPYKLPDWSKSEKKIESRTDTILDAYRFLFGQSIPADRSMWSIGGQNVNADGLVREHGEYNQLLQSGLFIPPQYFCVEKNEAWHKLNATIQDGSHWLCGDFYTRMVEYASRSDLKPSITNVDGVKMPRTGGADYLAKIMVLLSQLDIHNILVVANFTISCYCHRGKYTDIPKEVIKHRLFHPIRHKWIIHPQIYIYKGSSQGNRTEMGSMLLYRYDE